MRDKQLRLNSDVSLSDHLVACGKCLLADADGELHKVYLRNRERRMYTVQLVRLQASAF
jgi:hypothetical protein